MKFNYPASAATARRLLDQFGQTITLSRTSDPVYDPITGEYTGGGTVTTTAFGVLLPVGDEAGNTLGDGGVIRADDRKFIIDASAEPDALTTLTDAGGGVWNIVNVVSLAPAGYNVLYKGFVRR